jgi:hypothetical protein
MGHGAHLLSFHSPAARLQEERIMHEAKLAKMEAEMKLVFQQKVMEKEGKLKQSEEELYARHREMKESLEKQRLELDDKKRKIESGRPLTPENKNNVRLPAVLIHEHSVIIFSADWSQKRVSSYLKLASCHDYSSDLMIQLRCCIPTHSLLEGPSYFCLSPLSAYTIATCCIIVLQQSRVLPSFWVDDEIATESFARSLTFSCFPSYTFLRAADHHGRHSSTSVCLGGLQPGPRQGIDRARERVAARVPALRKSLCAPAMDDV